MINLAVRVRELVSSNVDALIDKASNPAKMLGLLLTEVEENLIGLHGDLAKADRERASLAAKAESTAKTAEEWTAKAKTAVDHKREDLARAALLARESGRQEAAELAAKAEAAAGRVSEIEAAIARLEAKRQDIVARQRDAAPAPKSDDKPKDSRTAKRMDRLDAMERRVGFGASAEKSDAEIEAEIASLGEQSAIDAEIAAMKAPAKKAPRKKAK
jgi:phage shock protein A